MSLFKVDSKPWWIQYRVISWWNRFVRFPFNQILYICSWIPFLYNDINWDWTAIFAVLEFKLRRVERCLRRGYHLHRDRDADQVLEAAILCKRMHSDYNWYDKVFPALKPWSIDGKFNGCKYQEYMFEQDLTRFLMLFKKYVRNWWD